MSPAVLVRGSGRRVARVLSVAFAVILLALSASPALSGPAPAQEAATPSAQGSADLIKLLRDDKAREALIRELEQLSKGAPAAAASPAQATTAATTGTPASAPSGPPPSVSRQIAEVTQEAAQSVVTFATAIWSRIAAAPQQYSALGQADWGRLWSAVLDLALIAAATTVVFLVLRSLAHRIYRSMGRSAADAGRRRTLLLSLGSVGIDALVVILAWAAGYLIALLSIGDFGTIGIRQTLYLNAFLLIELLKVLIRAVLSPSTGDLRLLNLGDGAARYLNRWIALLVSILGYGQLLLVPIVNQQISFAAGRALSGVIALPVLFTVAVLIVRRRRVVADWLTGADREAQPGRLSRLARSWHWPALIYLAALAVIVLTRPEGMLFPVLGASGQILVAALVGFAAAAWLKSRISKGIELPEAVNLRLPLLERRLNAFVPRILLGLRLLIFAAVTLYAVHTLGLINIRAWMESQIGAQLSASVISVAVILLVAFLLWLAMTSWVEYRLNPDYGHAATPRERTLLTLLRNAATIAILVITLMFALSEVGLDIAPLLASAGVLGLAIGFGAQKLVQDIITGIFIQFENAINVGDVITVGGTTGTVERLTIRSVSLRDLRGVFHIIPFSSVDMVANYMRDFSYTVCDMGIAYREDVEEARQAMQDAYEELRQDPDHAPSLIGDLEWFGVVSFGDSAVVVRTRIKTLPGKQWAVERAYNTILKRVFDARDIEIPFPHQTIYFGVDKQGDAPPAHVALRGQDSGASEEAEDPAAEPRMVGERQPG